jgi:hypothetical protein
MSTEGEEGLKRKREESPDRQSSAPVLGPVSSVDLGIIYIQESVYGLRHSKYATEFRRIYPDFEPLTEADSTTQSFLTEWKNVATIKLIPNPFYRRAQDSPPVEPELALEKIKDAKRQNKTILVTQPSIEKYPVSSIDVKPSGKTHSEQVAARALGFGYKKSAPSDKMDAAFAFDDITDSGKYLVQWIYTEREPCIPPHYTNSCSTLIKDIADTQFRRYQIPIEVYYTFPRPHSSVEDKKQYHAEKREEMYQVVRKIESYPLQFDKRQSLIMDAEFSQTIIRQASISQEDISKFGTENPQKEFEIPEAEKRILTRLKEIKDAIRQTQSASEISKLLEERGQLITQSRTFLPDEKKSLSQQDETIDRLKNLEQQCKVQLYHLVRIPVQSQNEDDFNELVKEYQMILSVMNTAIAKRKGELLTGPTSPIKDDAIVSKYEERLTALQDSLSVFIQENAQQKEKNRIHEEKGRGTIPLVKLSSKKTTSQQEPEKKKPRIHEPEKKEVQKPEDEKQEAVDMMELIDTDVRETHKPRFGSY